MVNLTDTAISKNVENITFEICARDRYKRHKNNTAKDYRERSQPEI